MKNTTNDIWQFEVTSNYFSYIQALEISAEEDIELLCNTFLNYAFCPICVGMEDGATSDYVDPSGSADGQPIRGRGMLTYNLYLLTLFYFLLSTSLLCSYVL